jgi:hypothetical protein
MPPFAVGFLALYLSTVPIACSTFQLTKGARQGHIRPPHAVVGHVDSHHHLHSWVGLKASGQCGLSPEDPKADEWTREPRAQLSVEYSPAQLPFFYLLANFHHLCRLGLLRP